MYIYLDKQGVVKEIINDEALRQSASNVNEICVYYDGLQESDIGSVLATYGLPDGTITDEMEVATQTQEMEIPYDAERDLKYFQYYKAYPFYRFSIADLALSQEGVVRLMIRLAQKDGEYIKVAGLICFDVEGELVKEDHGVSLAQYNYLVKAWVDTKRFLLLDGSKAMQGNLDMGAHNVLLNGKTLKDNNGALNYNGSDLAKQSDTSSLQSQIDTINATQNVVDIVGTKAELNAYETKDLHANDKIEVLTDESQNNANTIYEWNGDAWSLVGSKAPYYSKVESDARYNELKAKSYDKDTTAYVTGHVPDSGMVKKSLDSLSENLETAKIQVDTNKKNIAKNTQNIENLSKVMPTDINVDENGYAILEHDGTEITGQKKQVKFAQMDKKASFSEVTIPSANALKTKDGTSIGGSDVKIFEIDYSRFVGDENPTATLTTEEVQLFKDSDLIYVNNFSGIEGRVQFQKFGTNGGIYVQLENRAIAMFGIGLNNNFLQSQELQIELPDVSSYQNTLYRHTVLISEPTNKTSYLVFTAESEMNIVIDSIQDLITVFGNKSIACSGLYRDGDEWNQQSYLKINVGTSISNTTITAITLGLSFDIQEVSDELFSDNFGHDFTITDNVTAMW